MNISLKEILKSKPAFEKIINQDIDIKKAFALAKLIGSLNINLSHYADVKKKAFEKYILPNQNASKEVQDEQSKLFDEEIKKLLEVEVDLGDFEKFKLDEFSGCKLSASDAIILNNFFE